MKFRRIFAALIVTIAATHAALAANITSTSLRIQGAGLRVLTESVVTGIDLPASVQTEFGGKTNDEATAPEELTVVGDLTGPGLDTPVPLTTAPGHKFEIPGLKQIGTYYLQNIRLMNGTEFLQYATPSVVTITVSDLLQTKVTVKQLTPEEIRARGIVVDARNFDVYEYSFTFIIKDQEVVVPFPVIIDPRTHEAFPVASESPYKIPSDKIIEPPRWTPPQIIATEFGEESDGFDWGKDPLEKNPKGAPFKIPAAIVIPNSLAVLHQFFAVGIVVTNGAPADSDARLENIYANIKIPTALRTVKTEPTVAMGAAVPIVEPKTGVTFLLAQGRGEAEWTLEGLHAGTYPIDIDLHATLKRTGQDDLALHATPRASVVVHDPRFNITFSHPDTVRKGIEYSTYAFITNMSGTEQTITVASGVQGCDVNPNGNVCRLSGAVSDLITIPANDMRVIEYRLRSNVIGHVFATAGTLDDDEHLSAKVQLTMGVSETGIPLSPVTLILPYYAQFVEPDVVSANLQLFGLGFSLATAPVNAMTAKFPRVIQTDVFQRAVDLSRAGQRIFISNSNAEVKRDSLVHMTLDLLGNGGHDLREWDALRRQEKSGRMAGAAGARQLEATGLANGATMRDFIDSMASATAWRSGYVAVLAHGAATGDRPYAVSLTGRSSARSAQLPNEAEAAKWVRTLPYSDIDQFNGAGENGELAMMGRWVEDLDASVTPAADGQFSVEVIYPNTADGTLLKAHFDLTGHKGETLTIPITRGDSALDALLPNGGIASTGSVSTVSPQPLTLLGARQDLYLDENGHKVSVLYNRPVSTPEGVDLLTRFDGEIDFNKDSVVFKGPRPLSSAALQEDRRTVNLTFDHVLSINADYTLASGNMIDPTTSAEVSFPEKVAIKIDNASPAAILYGKVLKGDNTPIPHSEITIRQYKTTDGKEPSVPPQWDVTNADGAFLFEYVRREIEAYYGGAYRAVAVTPDGKTTTIEGSVRLPNKVHFLNIQLLGRGSAEGYVRYDNGEVAAGARVTVGSTMFNIMQGVEADAKGYYRIDDLPVGPLTFSAIDKDGNTTFAAAEIATPGQLVTQNLSIYRKPFPGSGRIYGVVRRSDTNAPVAGAHVGVFAQGYGLTDGYTDSQGRFDFAKVPAGFVTLLASEWGISRQAVSLDFDLRADEVKQSDMIISVLDPAEKPTTLTGQVLREKLLAPGTYEPAAGALVKIGGYKTVTADALGNFRYDDIPVSFSQKNITAYDPSTQRVKAVQIPTLTEAGPNTMSIVIGAFDRGYGTVRVRLVNAGGIPVSGYRVIVPGFPPDRLDDKGNGVYELPNVPVGTSWNIWAVPPGPRNIGPNGDKLDDSRPYGDQTASGHGQVLFDGHVAAVTLRLPGEGTVRVKVRSQFDLITPVALSYPAWDENEQGMYGITLKASTEKLGEADWAVFPKIPAMQTYGVTSLHPQYGYASQNAQLFFDGDFRDHILQLNTLATVRGTVYAIDGLTPIAGASVRIFNGRSDPGPQITGPDGRFEFRDQPSATGVTVTAEVTQSDIYRTGYATATTPPNGGVVEGMSVVMRKRGFVDGRVVYKDYKVFDPNNALNNVPDNTPNDYSDNAPVPLARFYLRELDFPNRDFGKNTAPLITDNTGRFLINGVFVGALRATAWDSSNEELRGDWTGSITEEGAEATPKAYIAIGGGGVGEARITVVDPNQSYAEVPNAEVGLYRGGARFDFTSTDGTGVASFAELPVGVYNVSAYSKALGKTSQSESITITRDGIATARLRLEFSGMVDGHFVDPEANDKPVAGAAIRLTAANYSSQASTDVAGAFTFLGVREGSFRLEAKDTQSNRRATADDAISILDPHRTVTLKLEPTETLRVGVYQPDDFGKNSGTLAPIVTMEVKQRCYFIAFVEHCEYRRELQGNPIDFTQMFKNEPYAVTVREIGGKGRVIGTGDSFPNGTVTKPISLWWPAYGDVHAVVTQGGLPAQNVKVTISGSGKGVIVYTDSDGKASAYGMPLGGVYVQAESIDGRFTGGKALTLAQQSVPVTAEIALGTYAGVTGTVIAEGGAGPSVGTRVVAHFAGNTADMRTDGSGKFTILGIPAVSTGTAVDLTFIGPDDTTFGASRRPIVYPDSGVWDVGQVPIDATPPQLESIIPADGATNVSPDAKIKILFSEPLNTDRINTGTVQLVAADGSNAAYTLAWADEPGNKFSITISPTKPATGFPLRSNTLYRVVISGQLTDVTGHPLPSDRGFSFTTTDYAEPRVLKALPASPIKKPTTFEFRFNEPINPAPWQPGGTGGVFHIYKLAAPGGPGAAILLDMGGRAFVDPATYMTLYFAPDESHPIEPESFYRVVFSGVTDPQGNVTPEQTFHFFSYDEVAPVAVFVSPVEGAQLVSGSEYELKLELHNGSTSGTIATDVKKVEFFTVAADGTETPFAAPSAAPFSTKIIGPEAPVSGTTLKVGAQPYDTSDNQGPKAYATWTVKPNAAPVNVVVTPTQASAYPSNNVSAIVTFDDEGSFASVTTAISVPRTNGLTFTKSVTQSYDRNSSGLWPEAKFTFTLPADATAGAVATLTTTVADVRGLTSAAATATIAIAEDHIQPTIISVTPTEGTSYFKDATFTIVATVSDAESTVQNVAFLVDGDPVALASSGAGVTAGTQKFTSAQVKVPAKAEDTQVPIVVTATDYNGNSRSTTFYVTYKGVYDPDAPKVTWLCPIDRAAIPADYTNFSLSLKVRAIDPDLSSVKFRLEGDTPTTVNAGTPSGNDYPGTIAFTKTPASGTITITAVVTDAAAHVVELPITLDVIKADFIYTDPKAITPEQASGYDNKTIALIGSAAQLAPQSALKLANLLVLNGAKLQTLATTVAKEYRVDVTVSGLLYVDCASSIDETSRGYVGGWANTSDGQNSDFHGRTVGNTTTGGCESGAQGSHAGIGGNADGNYKSNAPYGSIFRPTDLGSGGGGSPSCCTAGASGGGAIALHAVPVAETDAARIVIAGSVIADGGYGFSPTTQWAGGSGGSVWVEGKQVLLSPAAHVTANGGDDDGSAPGSWGAGGGRVAVTATTKLDLSTAVVEARGGRNWNQGETRTVLDGGAGTVYVRKPGQERGDLTVSSSDSRFAGSLHLTRYTPLGRIGRGTATAVAANALTDSTRTFDKWMVGEELTVAANTSRTFTVVSVSADGKTLKTDPLDGSLLDVATSQTVAYSGALVFDNVTAGPRALLRFDQSIVVNGVADDKTKITADSTAAVLLADEQPALTFSSVPAPGGNVVLNTNLAATYGVSATGGVQSVTLNWSPEATPRVDRFDDYPSPTQSKTVSLTVPSTTPTGPATLKVTVKDRADRTYAVATQNYTITTNQAPTVDSFTVTPPSLSMYAGHPVTVVVTASDDIAVKSVALNAHVGATTISSASRPTDAKTTTQTFTFDVPQTQAGPATLALDVAVSDAFPGRAATAVTQNVAILQDTVGPVLTNVTPSGGSYRESVDKIAVRVTAIDSEVAVKEVSAQLDGGTAVTLTKVSGTNDWTGDIVAPIVDGDADVQRQLTITAKDFAGNSTTSAPVTVTITPIVDPNAPLLSWSCGTDGAMFPPGYSLKLRAIALPANAQNPVQVVEMYVDDATTTLSVTAKGNNTYEAPYAIPADAAEGKIVRVRVVARAAGGAAADLLTTFTVAVPTNTISGDTLIDTTVNTAPQTLLVTAGVVTLKGAHTFDRIMLLGGSIVPNGTDLLDLKTTRGMYVACGAALDATGRGYAKNATYPGASVPGNGWGGSHFGAGGNWDNLGGSSFGSIYQPREAGSGGGNGGIGGGVIRLDVAKLTVDGAVRANGARDSNTGGGGGSVWITSSSTVNGGGSVEANGGPAYFGSGAGGAVAIEYATVSPSLPALRASTGTNDGYERYGAPGTVYLRGPNSVYGSLSIDNVDRDGQYIDLPSLGSGTVQSVTGKTVASGRATDIPKYFERHWVEIRDAAGNLKGTWRIATVNFKDFTLEGADVNVAAGDKWQGVYRFDNAALRRVRVDSGDPIRATTETIDLWVELDRVSAKDLRIRTGYLSAVMGRTLNIDVTGELRVDTGALIDLNGRGYASNVTNPNAIASGNGGGGTHIGRGGLWDAPQGTSYGSIYRPMELGAGGGNGGLGGGALRVNAKSVVVDGTIRASGARQDSRGGAGGSIWITTNSISGAGRIEADGGFGYFGSGGGGALSLTYTDATSIKPALSAVSGGNDGYLRYGGPGSIYVFNPQSTYGDLTVDHGGINGQPTQFPALGSGSITSVNGNTITTNRTAAIPAYFAGHWIEVSNGGVLRGTWRIAEVRGTSLVLEGSGITAQAGDTWQGVYRFDNFTVRGTTIDSSDPIRVAANQTIAGWLETDRISAQNLTIASGATVTHAAGGKLTFDVPGELRVDGLIDASGRGYSTNVTDSTAVGAGNATGGTHIGRGGSWDDPLGTSYGSIYHPTQPGAGGGNGGAGGGVIFVHAGSLIVNGAIAANGTRSNNVGGAGGSIWIQADRVSGAGSIQANGGQGYFGSGGGGAIAIEYTNPTTALPAAITAYSGGNDGYMRMAGPGSIYITGPQSTYGDLRLDHGTIDGNPTQLPSLGSGIAQPGSGGSTVLTARTVPIPSYFQGHWVEISDVSGTLKGTWRIASISGTSFTLEGSGISIGSGDRWQGVYRFDTVLLRGLTLDSADPIRAAKTTVQQWLQTDSLTSDDIVITSGATVSHAAGGSLTLRANNLLQLDAGGAINVSGSGYGTNVTFPGEVVPGNATGGSHVGIGGAWDGPFGTVYGSIYRPAELGAGGGNGGAGGGTVRLIAKSTVVNGDINADGKRSNNVGGAGGSIWITTESFGGTGTMHANGGQGYFGSGGGGAISVEYSSSTSMPTLRAVSGGNDGYMRFAGAGSVYTRGPQATYGTMTIDSTGASVGQPSAFASLGRGNVVAVNGTDVTTDRVKAIPSYFVGHWVDILASNGLRKGTWRIAAVNDRTVTLEANAASGAPNVIVGDLWRGIYLFDKLTLRNASLMLLDDVRGPIDAQGGTVTINEPPTVDLSRIATLSQPDVDVVTGTAGAVVDSQAPVTVKVMNVRTGTVYSTVAAADGSFRVTVGGEPGDRFTLYASDAAALVATSALVEVPGALALVNGVASVTVTPSAVKGGSTATVVVRLQHPLRHASEGVITLSSSAAAALVPASITMLPGTSSASFTITTSAVANDTTANITATNAVASASASLTLLGGATGATSLSLTSNSLQGGSSVTATIVLGGPAPVGGAVVSLTTSDARYATLPETVVVPAGATSAAVTVTTYSVAAPTPVTISATYGATVSATATLTACATFGTATPPASIDLGTVWVDDTAPTGATKSGDAVFDSTQVASGSLAAHLSGAPGVHTFALTGATATLPVASTDRLVVWALVNPCNPPKQILIGWKTASTEYRASWGETRMEPTTASLSAGTIPSSGEWTRLEVLASTLGVPNNAAISTISIRTQDGEAWFDAIGKKACSLTRAAAPELNPREVVWFDDAPPQGAVLATASGSTSAWTFDTTQAASGNSSHVETTRAGLHQHYFNSATVPLTAGVGDMLYAYVLLDPCNPPKELMLQWILNNGADPNHRVFWGDDLIAAGTTGLADRYRMGPLPELGKWVRLEVPASFVGLEGQSITGAAFSVYDGQAWFDRSGKISRVNLALGGTATQSSTFSDGTGSYPAPGGNDGSTLGNYPTTKFAITQNTSQPWWQVDLGSVKAIDMIQIWNRTDGYTDRLNNFYVSVSDTELPATLAATLLDPSVSNYHFNATAGTSTTFRINRTGRYVRVQLAGSNFLQLAEVQVWAPVTAEATNHAGGKIATQSSDYGGYVATRAVNGGTSGYWYEQSTTHTYNDATGPYWDVNLGALQRISTIDLFNRTDCCFERLQNFWVFVSDTEFPKELTTVAQALAKTSTAAYYRGSGYKVGYTIPVNRIGQYVRVQLANADYLSLAEVQVWGPLANLGALSVTPPPAGETPDK